MKDKKQVIIHLPNSPEFKRNLKLMATHMGYDSTKEMIETTTRERLQGWMILNKKSLEALKKPMG